MPKYIEKVEQYTLPVLGLRGSVAFPSVTLSFELTDEICIRAAEAAFENDTPVLICAVAEPAAETLIPDILYRVGTVSRIKQSLKTPEGNMRVITEGFSRAAVTEFHTFADYITAEVLCKTVTMTDEDSIRTQAYCRAILSETEHLVSLLPSVSDDVMMTAKAIKNPAQLADFIAANILIKPSDKQSILQNFDPVKRIEHLVAILKTESSLLECEMDIHKKVRSNLNQNQTEYYLREQVRLIRPKVIVCLGRISAMRLIKPDFKITKEHGVFFTKNEYTLCAVYHPAALLRDPRKKEDMYSDMKKIAALLEQEG